MHISLIALIIYLWTFLGGIAVAIYEYLIWRRRHTRRDLILMLLGLLAVVAALFAIITKYLVPSGNEFAAILVQIRPIVGLVFAGTGLAVLWSQFKRHQ
jgi:peptidoglycan/LPS O-acetylase OafA/YrhL